MSLRIMGWQCSSTQNHLNLTFAIAVSPAVTSADIIPDPANSDLEILELHSASVMATTIRLLKFAEVDGLPTPVSFWFNNSSLTIQFPCFTSSIVYDPDFSVVLLSTSSSSSGGPDLTLLALLSLLAIPIVMILVVLAAVLLIYLIKRPKTRLGSVNFGHTEETASL